MEPMPEGFTLNDRGQTGNKKLDSRCGYFAGPTEGFIPQIHIIIFAKPTLAQFITLQILDTEFLQVNGVKINKGDYISHFTPFTWESPLLGEDASRQDFRLYGLLGIWVILPV